MQILFGIILMSPGSILPGPTTNGRGRLDRQEMLQPFLLGSAYTMVSHDKRDQLPLCRDRRTQQADCSVYPLQSVSQSVSSSKYATGTRYCSSKDTIAYHIR